MKRTTQEKVLWALEELKDEVRVPDAIREKSAFGHRTYARHSLILRRNPRAFSPGVKRKNIQVNIPVVYEDEWLLVVDETFRVIERSDPKKESRTLTGILNQDVSERGLQYKLYPVTAWTGRHAAW